jgi:DMSO/TMAO reductase YedYZ molybdopterin-dependent catalytic subunit
MRGPIGNAEWTGPGVGDVLKLAGTDLNSSLVEVNAVDVGVAKNQILSVHFRSSSQRLIVPGWDGTSWVKWVTRLMAAAELSTGFT